MIKPVLLAAAALLAAYTVSFLAYALYPRTGPADIAVVFGNRVLEDGTPSPRLRARLRAATLAYEQHLVPRILVSGGRGASGYDEATVMKDTLVHAGIPASAVLVDSAGTNTQATVRNAMRVVRDLGLQRVMVVTQYFHVPRCMLAFHKAGVGEVVAAYPAFVEPRDIYSVSREMVALPVQGVVDSGILNHGRNTSVGNSGVDKPDIPAKVAAGQRPHTSGVLRNERRDPTARR